jgi:hypothetical protein
MRKIIDFLFIGEYKINWLRTFLAILVIASLSVIFSVIVHHIRYKCVRGHHDWVMHHSKGGHHLSYDFICDEEVLRSDTTKHIYYNGDCDCR